MKANCLNKNKMSKIIKRNSITAISSCFQKKSENRSCMKISITANFTPYTPLFNKIKISPPQQQHHLLKSTTLPPDTLLPLHLTPIPISVLTFISALIEQKMETTKNTMISLLHHHSHSPLHLPH
jgi:hypothetical protein